MTHIHGRRDKHHAEIKDGLREAGYWVGDLADMGAGWPDLLVISQTGLVTLMEVKTDKEPLTQAERLFFDTCPGQCVVVHSTEDAVMMLRMAEDQT